MAKRHRVADDDVDSGKPPSNDFLNPNSMLTPGALGAVIMAIALTLWHRLGFDFVYSALVLSFLAGLLVFSSQHFATHNVPAYVRTIYYTFNSLIIFVMATGTNGVGSEVTMFTSKPPTCAGRTLALPRKDRDIRYLRPLGNSDIAVQLPHHFCDGNGH